MLFRCVETVARLLEGVEVIALLCIAAEYKTGEAPEPLRSIEFCTWEDGDEYEDRKYM